MLCTHKPPEQPWGCGRCLACRINRQREWVSRMIFEASCWEYSAFITLTYEPRHLPVRGLLDGTPAGVLCKRDAQLFLKRLRKRMSKSGRRFRYFLVGEYGDRTMRPHYHAILFGVDPREAIRVGSYDVHPDVQEAWGLGFTSCSPMNGDRLKYCAGYVTKKLTRDETDWEEAQLQGRDPEFMLSSRRPGIGCLPGFLHNLAESLLQSDPEAEDVPPVFMRDSHIWPMPKLVAAKVREELGMERLAADRPPRPRPPGADDQVVRVVGVDAMGRAVEHTVTRAHLDAARREAREKAARLRRRSRRKAEGREL